MTEMTQGISDLLREREYLETWLLCHGDNLDLIAENQKVCARLHEISAQFKELGADSLNG